MTTVQKTIRRILIVRWDSPAHFRNLSTLANYLASHGMEVTLATMTTVGDADAGLLPTVRFITYGWPSRQRPSLWGRYRMSLWLSRVMRDTPHDVLYVFDSWTLWFVILARFLSGRRNRTPWIYHTIDWLEPGRYPVQAMLEQWACRHASRAVNTDRTRARLQQALYKLASMPEWIPNYLSRDEPFPVRDEKYRQTLLPTACSGDSLLLVHATVAVPARLVIELIRALALADARLCLLQIAVDNDYRRDCERIADELGVRDRIRFHPPVSYRELMRILVCADVSALFHDHRSSSGYYLCNADRLSLLAGCGIPFVASDYPNMEAMVYRYGLGECCDPYAQESIAAALNALVQGPPSLAERKKKARAAFDRYLHFEAHGERLINMLQSLSPP